MNNNQSNKLGVECFSVVNKLPFLNYLKNVINVFDKRNYQLIRINLIEVKVIDKIVTPCFLLVDTGNKSVIKEGDFISKFHLRELYCKYQKDMGVIILNCTKKDNIPLLNNDLSVNLNKNLLTLFPYLEGVVLDLINHKYEFNQIDYDKLNNGIRKNYVANINERQTFLICEKKEREQKEKTTTEELSKLLSYIDTLNLDEITKESLKNRIKIKI